LNGKGAYSGVDEKALYAVVNFHELSGVAPTLLSEPTFPHCKNAEDYALFKRREDEKGHKSRYKK